MPVLEEVPKLRLSLDERGIIWLQLCRDADCAEVYEVPHPSAFRIVSSGEISVSNVVKVKRIAEERRVLMAKRAGIRMARKGKQPVPFLEVEVRPNKPLVCVYRTAPLRWLAKTRRWFPPGEPKQFEVVEEEREMEVTYLVCGEPPVEKTKELEPWEEAWLRRYPL